MGKYRNVLLLEDFSRCDKYCFLVNEETKILDKLAFHGVKYSVSEGEPVNAPASPATIRDTSIPVSDGETISTKEDETNWDPIMANGSLVVEFFNDSTVYYKVSCDQGDYTYTEVSRSTSDKLEDIADTQNYRHTALDGTSVVFGYSIAGNLDEGGYRITLTDQEGDVSHALVPTDNLTLKPGGSLVNGEPDAQGAGYLHTNILGESQEVLFVLDSYTEGNSTFLQLKDGANYISSEVDLCENITLVSTNENQLLVDKVGCTWEFTLITPCAGVVCPEDSFCDGSGNCVQISYLDAPCQVSTIYYSSFNGFSLD